MTISSIFNYCVYILEVIGEVTGWGYELANLIIFIGIQPALILLFFGMWLRIKLLYRLHMKSLSTYNSITSI